jgi:hypothetical protein
MSNAGGLGRAVLNSSIGLAAFDADHPGHRKHMMTSGSMTATPTLFDFGDQSHTRTRPCSRETFCQ